MIPAGSMPNPKLTPSYIAAHIRRVLKDGGSAPHAEDVQRFYKEVVESRGWRTAELRKVAVRFRRAIVKEAGLPFLVQVADELFSGRVLEEKHFAVFLLEKMVDEDSMVQKRLGWRMREAAKADPKSTVSYLMKIRAKSPRLVLRTACETLPSATCKRVLIA